MRVRTGEVARTLLPTPSPVERERGREIAGACSRAGFRVGPPCAPAFHASSHETSLYVWLRETAKCAIRVAAALKGKEEEERRRQGGDEKTFRVVSDLPSVREEV